jgi:hypothetical protein
VFEAVKKLEDSFVAAANKVTNGAAPLRSLQDDVLNCFYQLYYRLDLN